jgi:polyisoprenoid-binding protein YceI
MVPKIRIVYFLPVLFSIHTASAQTLYRQTGNSYLAISGTSTLNEWTMTSKDARVHASFEMGADESLRKVTSLSLSVRSESLKSGHQAMDKNAYSTLATDTHKVIAFEITSSTILDKKIHCTGNLTVAGVTKQIEIESTYRVMVDRSLLFSGSEKLKMSDFNVEAPTFMFGTVTTGDEITVSFNIELIPSRK